MKIMLISALQEYGWWDKVTDPPRYYNWGALGDLFPKEVFYCPTSIFMSFETYPKAFDIVFVQQAKAPINYHLKVIKKVKLLMPEAKIVLLQEGEIQRLFELEPEEQVRHCETVRDKVDLVYTHEDDISFVLYSNLQITRKFYTPYPVKWVSQFKIPFNERKYDLISIGSMSKVYGGIRTWTLQQAIPDKKILLTMCNRGNGFYSNWKNVDILPEMHWHEWIKRVADCRYYYNPMPVIGAKSFDLACLSLDVYPSQYHYEDYKSLCLPLESYDFPIRKEVIREELEEVLRY
ncbi:MAG: hypothetical protein DRI44_02640 [Chlamydiae bacterium]|nr:MAG: hypothetical protein DRI44_02640 [Chlamydiota bacterium]